MLFHFFLSIFLSNQTDEIFWETITNLDREGTLTIGGAEADMGREWDCLAGASLLGIGLGLGSGSE